MLEFDIVSHNKYIVSRYERKKNKNKYVPEVLKERNPGYCLIVFKKENIKKRMKNYLWNIILSIKYMWSLNSSNTKEKLLATKKKLIIK